MDIGSFEGNPADRYWKKLEKDVKVREKKMVGKLSPLNIQLLAKEKSLTLKEKVKLLEKEFTIEEIKSYSGMTRNGIDEDKLLVSLAKKNGFDSLPVKVSKTEFESIVEKNEAPIIFRGLKDKKFVEQFISGDYYGGRGIYGNGSYFTTKEIETLNYSGMKGGYLSATFDKRDMKIIKSLELAELSKNYVETESDEFTRAVLKNKGCLALLEGYDAIHVESKDYYIVLNRGKLIVSEVIKSHFGG